MALMDELTKLKKDLETAQSEKIRLETQLQIIEKDLLESLGTCDLEMAKNAIEERKGKVEASKKEIQEGVAKIQAENAFLGTSK